MTYCLAADVVVTGKTDPQKTAMIAVASEIIDKLTGDSFEKYDATTYLFSGQGRSMLLVNPSLRALTKVEYRDDADELYTEIEVSNVLWARTWIKRKTLYWRRGTGNVKLTGDWGWPTVPAIVKQACILIATDLLLGADEAPGAIKSESFGPYSYSVDTSSLLKGGFNFANGSALMEILINTFTLHPIFGGATPKQLAIEYDSYPCPLVRPENF